MASECWDKIRRERDGYFLELPEAEAASINAVDDSAAPAAGHADRAGLTAELYGEINSAGVATLFQHTALQPTLQRHDFVFVDLGSGTGKMTTQVAIDHTHCMRAIGVELSETRHSAGVSALAEGVDRGWISADQRSRILLLNQNALEADMSEANVVYLANYAFSDELSQRIADAVLSVEAAPQLEVVFTLREFQAPERVRLILVEKTTAEMSWARGQEVYVYARKRKSREQSSC